MGNNNCWFKPSSSGSQLNIDGDKMDSHHRDMINFNRPDLVKNTNNIKRLLEVLVDKNIITRSCAERMKNKSDEKEQATELYLLLPKLGTHAFPALVEALWATENETAALILKDNRLSNNSPTEGLSPDEECADSCEERYRMKSYPYRGSVLIVNVFKYEDDWREQRDGSLKDVDDLKDMFSKMGYFVSESPAKGTKEEIEKSLVNWKDEKFLRDVDCGIIILMAHGTEVITGSVVIETSDKKTIETEWIISLLSSSEAPLLHGKPKLIFILSCRGKYPDMGTDMDKVQQIQDAANRNTQLEANVFDTTAQNEGYAPVSPHLSDILLIYPCAPGKASARDPLSGSWFVQEMIRVFRKKAYKDDVESMLKEMDRSLIKQRQKGEKESFQTVCYTSRGFKRKLFLNPVSASFQTNGNSA